MVKGVGTDLLDISRMTRHVANAHFMSRVFTAAEIAYIDGYAHRAAGIFCAKEACLKALGVGLRLPLVSIEIKHEEGGRPYIELEGMRVHLSITHTRTTACAVVVIETERDTL